VGPRGKKGEPGWTDLAPEICRQRMILEGTLYNPFEADDMIRYCKEISKVLNMTPIGEPITDFAEKYGWCAYMHWKESGMHIYSWNVRDPKFFSIDIYTCKKFKYLDVVRYTTEFFEEDLIKLTWKE
jgi:S-adenosylmethionine decarboxylase